MSVEVKIEFERECSRCYSNGYLLSVKGTDRPLCDRCNGLGRVATELGNELLEFLEHQGIESPSSERGVRE